MAKSIRSKRGKKMRAIKRVRYTQKQLKQLKETVAKTVPHHDSTEGSMNMDVVRAEVTDYVELKKKEVAEKLKKKEGDMDTGELPVYSTKTMKDQNGDYPKWMGQKQVRKQKHKNNKSRKGNGRKKGW